LDGRSTRPPVRGEAPDVANEIQLLRVADDAQDVGQRGDFGLASGRVTAGRDDPRARILARDAADRLPRPLIGRSRDRTRVHDDEIGVAGRYVDAAGRAQILLDAERVRLIHAAAECDDGVLHSLPDPTAYDDWSFAAAASTLSANFCL
jgi:hypothetical protein